MPHKFERVRMEPFPDGSVNIGLHIVATLANDEPDPNLHAGAQWAVCRVAHAHGWDTCDVQGLFTAKEKDSKGADVVGTSKKEVLEAWLASQRAQKAMNIPSEIPIPLKRDGQGKVVKDIDGKTSPDKVIALQ